MSLTTGAARHLVWREDFIFDQRPHGVRVCRQTHLMKTYPNRALIAVRMIDSHETFDHLAARVLFSIHEPIFTWIKGQLMPESFAADVYDALRDKGALRAS